MTRDTWPASEAGPLAIPGGIAGTPGSGLSTDRPQDRSQGLRPGPERQIQAANGLAGSLGRGLLFDELLPLLFSLALGRLLGLQPVEDLLASPYRRARVSARAVPTPMTMTADVDSVPYPAIEDALGRRERRETRRPSGLRQRSVAHSRVLAPSA